MAKRGEHRVYMTTKQHVKLADAINNAAKLRLSYDDIARELIDGGMCPLSIAPLPKKGSKSRIRVVTDEHFAHLMETFPPYVVEEYRQRYGHDPL